MKIRNYLKKKPGLEQEKLIAEKGEKMKKNTKDIYSYYPLSDINCLKNITGKLLWFREDNRYIFRKKDKFTGLKNRKREEVVIETSYPTPRSIIDLVTYLKAEGFPILVAVKCFPGLMIDGLFNTFNHLGFPFILLPPQAKKDIQNYIDTLNTTAEKWIFGRSTSISVYPLVKVFGEVISGSEAAVPCSAEKEIYGKSWRKIVKPAIRGYVSTLLKEAGLA